MINWFSYSIIQEGARSLAIRHYVDTRFTAPISFHTLFSSLEKLEVWLTFWSSMLASSWFTRSTRWGGTITPLRQDTHLDLWKRKRTFFFIYDHLIPHKLDKLFFPSYFHTPIWALCFPVKWFSGFVCSCQKAAEQRVVILICFNM